VNQDRFADELSDSEEIIDEITEELHDNDDTAVVENTTSESEDEVTPIRQARVRKTPAKFNDYVTGREAEEENELHNLAVFNNSQDPSTYEEAMKIGVWREAMNAEIESIQRNDTWELTVLPTGCKSIGVKWVYKTKYNEKGEIDKYKARLVAKGYTQRHGIDFNEVFAHVARWDTIRSILALAANNRWNVFQLDVKSVFLHGELAEDIYVNQPAGYDNGDKSMCTS
jgi:hypothetical protein